MARAGRLPAQSVCLVCPVCSRKMNARVELVSGSRGCRGFRCAGRMYWVSDSGVAVQYFGRDKGGVRIAS